MPLDTAERNAFADTAKERLFAAQEPIAGPLSLYEAVARAIRYQAEFRVRLMEQAAALGQLDVAQFDLLPKLTANAGYTTRSNEAFGFGFTPGGQIAANPSAAVERSHETASIGFAWNVLDFGTSYFRAKQLADQSLVAEERRRKALQNLMQDVRLAWWRAEAAQRLLPVIDGLLDEVDQTIEKTRVIESRKLLPPMQTASLRRSLLDLVQQISARRQDLAQARIELAALIGAPPGSDVKVQPSTDISVARLDLIANPEALESIGLRNRPELAEEGYKGRITDAEARRAMLALFPNLSLNLDENYDSNRFLVNHNWASAGVGVAFNLVKAFSLPALERSSEAQKQVDEARRLAMAMAVITQIRVAAVRYGLIAHEYSVWNNAEQDDERIVGFLSSSSQVGIDTELELIRARARLLVTRISRDLLYANLEAALGRLYNSTGFDILPEQMPSLATEEIARALKARIEEWQKANFAVKPERELPSIAIGAIDGVPAAAMDEFKKAIADVLEFSKLSVVPESQARLRLESGVHLEPLRDGGRPAIVQVKLVDIKTGALRFTTETHTTLSEPVDAAQWRTLGEGVGYRAVGPALRPQASRAAAVSTRGQASELKMLVELGRLPVLPASALRDRDEPLPLRLDTALTGAMPASFNDGISLNVR